MYISDGVYSNEEKCNIIIDIVGSPDFIYIDCALFLEQQGVVLESNILVDQRRQFMRYLQNYEPFLDGINLVKLFINQRKTTLFAYTRVEKEILIQQFVSKPKFQYADVDAILRMLELEVRPNFYERKIQILTDALLNLTPEKFYPIIWDISSALKSRRAEILSRTHRLYINADPAQVRDLLNKLTNKLQIQKTSLPHRIQLKNIITEYFDHPEVAKILNKQKYPFADSDSGFTTVYNQEHIEANQNRMTELNTEKHHSQSYITENNPFLTAAQRWEKKLEEFKFPASSCTDCH